MRFINLGLAAALLLICACSKSASDSSSASSAADPAPTEQATPPPPSDEMVQAVLADLEKKVQAQQFDAAVGSLLTLKDFPKSDKEQQAYEKQLRATSDALVQRANQGDEAARASYQMLGRVMTGR